MYTVAQAHTEYMFFPRAFAISWHSLKLLLLMEAVTTLSEELSELDDKPNGWRTLRPISLEMAGKCSFISRGSDSGRLLHHWENIHSLAVVHQVTLFL